MAARREGLHEVVCPAMVLLRPANHSLAYPSGRATRAVFLVLDRLCPCMFRQASNQNWTGISKSRGRTRGIWSRFLEEAIRPSCSLQTRLGLLDLCQRDLPSLNPRSGSSKLCPSLLVEGLARTGFLWFLRMEPSRCSLVQCR